MRKPSTTLIKDGKEIILMECTYNDACMYLEQHFKPADGWLYKVYEKDNVVTLYYRGGSEFEYNESEGYLYRIK